jgi:hypothetical protein
MADVIQHLAAISTGYKVFENDQVLTKEPLNGLVDYLDDQQRLTRVALQGVGIFCGLRVSLSADAVVLTKGVGVTTDGDLLRVPADLRYTRFRPYDESAPKYDRLYDGEEMAEVFELLGEEVEDAGALSTFQATTGRNAGDMVAVLLMESFQKDLDLCTGGDCDNKGKDALCNIRLLLLDQEKAGPLRETLQTADAASRRLEPLFADRLLLDAQINSTAALAAAYRKAAGATRERLRAALPLVFPACGAILADLFGKDPSPSWQARLDEAVPDTGIQAYYDFLNDVVQTFNELGEALAGNTAVCSPPLEAFPKHLLLGVVGAVSQAVDANRTGCYPSPLVGAGAGSLERARFLARRLDTLIRSFTVGIDPAVPVTITPSRPETARLGDRAIPAYYRVDMNDGWPIHRAWSPALEARGMAQQNYSANGAAYGARGAAVAPLAAQIAPYPFLRVEGVLGKSAASAVNEIESTIRRFNLPFVVRAVLMGADRPKITVRPPIRYTDLHRVHHLLRQDLIRQLDDVSEQTVRVEKDVGDAVKDGVLDNRVLGSNVSLIGLATETREKTIASATSARSKLARSYSQYKAEPWQDDIKETMAQAAGMRLQMGDVSRTEIASPVDSLLSNKHSLWTEWMDQIIERKDQVEDEKLLFGTFIKQHPAAEHRGGVERGGTLVLLYDGEGKVVADVTLPYHWPDTAEPEPKEQPLTPPKSLPPILDKGWRLLKPVSRQIEDNITTRLDLFKKIEVDPIRTQPGRPITERPTLPSDIKDEGFRIQLLAMMSKSQYVEDLRDLLMNPSLEPTSRSQIEAQLKAADSELGASIKESMKVISSGRVDAKSEGAAAATILADAFSKVSRTTASGVARTVRGQTTPDLPAETKSIMSALLKGRGYAP